MPSASIRCCSEPASGVRHQIVNTSSRRVLVLEGMPGAGKTTLASHLDTKGQSVVPEYSTAAGTAIKQTEHPDVDHDDAHQSNWIRKHRLAAEIGESGVVWMDRDWITSLAYAYSLTEETGAGRELMADRCRWALDHLTTGRLAVATTYLVLLIDPAQSLQRRRGRLEPAHPWSHPGPLRRLAAFYSDPTAVIATFNAALAAAAAAADWVHLESPTRQEALDAATSRISPGRDHQ